MTKATKEPNMALTVSYTQFGAKRLNHVFLA